MLVEVVLVDVFAYRRGEELGGGGGDHFGDRIADGGGADLVVEMGKDVEVGLLVGCVGEAVVCGCRGC